MVEHVLTNLVGLVLLLVGLAQVAAQRQRLNYRRLTSTTVGASCSVLDHFPHEEGSRFEIARFTRQLAGCWRNYLTAPAAVIIPAAACCRDRALSLKRRHIPQLKKQLKKTICTCVQPKTATELVWRDLAFSYKRWHFTRLKTRLKKTIRTYSQAKESTAALPPRDRELAIRQLYTIRKTGWGICTQLANFCAELRDAKQSVLTQLGEVPSEELAKKLAPIHGLEVEIDQLLREFEPIANS